MAEGLQLVTVLLAKTLESRHYEVQGKSLGVRIHAALLAVVYLPSLRLSTGTRRRQDRELHGGGCREGVQCHEQVSQQLAHAAAITVTLALLYGHGTPRPRRANHCYRHGQHLINNGK